MGAKFAEQKINGEGLIMLATKGSQDQLIACGLKLVGDQLKLTKLVEQLQAQDSAVESSPPVAWKSSKPSGRPHLAKLPVVHHEGFSCPWPEKHRFKMAKFVKVMDWIVKDKLLESIQIFQPIKPSYKVVTCVHDKDYVDGFIKGSLPLDVMRKSGFHWSEGLVERCFLEVGGTMLAANLAMEYGLACSTGGGTHHAFPGYGSGFCMLNDLAITAKDMINSHILSKVLIVDLDVHQGDGTAFIFKDDESVFTFSAHCENNFPLRKQQSDLDVGLERGLNDRQYLDTVMDYLPWIFDTFKPDLVLYDAGVDPHQDDALGKLNLTDQDRPLK